MIRYQVSASGPSSHLVSNVMHVCIYELITVRLFSCFIYHRSEGHMVEWPSS